MDENSTPTPGQPIYEAPPTPGPQIPPPPNVPNQGTYYAPQAAPEPRNPGFGSAYKGKWEAAVLAFALGFLGIHKFYLGYKNEGTVMLVVSIVGAVCTAGIGTAVMAIISLIEAVRYVSCTQEDFETIYVRGRKGWL